QDHATLRLHPDGTRVDLRSPKRIDPYHSVGRDARGNRVARDAAGVGVIPKRPATLKGGRMESVSSGPDISEDELRSVKPRRRNRRKRRRLNHDIEFLRGPRNVPAAPTPRERRDLLKCVNYFACQYYAARGLLLDRSRVYDREKEQRLAKDRQMERTMGVPQHRIFHERDNTERGGAEASSTGLPDMYKALDGSALVAIGMLLQELVSTLLKPNVPPGWVKEMEAAGLAPSDESVGPENERAEATPSDSSDKIWDEPSSADEV
ncbi:hypothetical protein EI94DRAFT_1734689, partial [Lactarius quietus]